MTRWNIKNGDPVLANSGGYQIEGHVLSTFIFNGTKHYVIDVGETFVVSIEVRPNKKMIPLVRSNA